MWLRCALLVLVLALGGSTARAQSGVLEGQVIEAATGAPVPGANVVVRHDGDRLGTSADAEGHFRLADLEAGTYRVQATAIGYASAQERVRVVAGQVQSVRLVLEVQAYELNEIVVRGAPGRAETASTTVQRIAPAELARQDPATVAEVGRLIPAAHVQTNSRGQTLLYLRDAGERQVAQFFDGALLNVPWDNRVDLSLLPAAVVEEVTVSKGVPSVRYGANVLGGAVNFQLRTLTRPGQLTEVQGVVGAPRTARGSVTHLGRRGAFSYTGSLGAAAQSGFALPGGADLPYSQPGNALRTNTDRRFVNGFLRGAYQFGGGARLGASVLHVDAEKGIAPESHVDPAEEWVRYWRYPTWRKSMLVVNGTVPLGEEMHLRGAAWGSRFAQDIYQYVSVDYDRLIETQGDVDYTAGMRLIFEQSFGPGTLGLALNALTTRHHQTNVLYQGGAPQPDSNSVYRQHIFSLGAEYDLPLTRRLSATLGGSLDGTATPETGPWPARDPIYAFGLTSGLTYALTDAFTLRAAAGRKTRFPTMRELFGAALGKFVPNPELRPVSALLSEVGLAWRGARLSGEAVAFFNRTYDAIDQRTIQHGPEAGKEQRINLDGSRVYGLELVAAAQPTARLALDGHLTWMRPRGVLNGALQKLDEKPAWLGTLTLTYALPLGFDALLQAEYLGGVYARTMANTFTRLPGAALLDARLSYDVALPQLGGSEVFVRVNNLTDEMRLLQLGLPGPGREVLVGLQLSF